MSDWKTVIFGSGANYTDIDIPSDGKAIEQYENIVIPKRRLLVATNNQGKAKEIKAILAGIYDDVVTFKDLGYKIDTVEDGDTFMENARKKAVEAFIETGLDTIADDSGLCVDALDGAPGIYSARFSGEQATDEKNNQLLVEKLAGVAPEKRTAKFVCAICLMRKDLPVVTAYGEIHGRILDEPRGENGFGYDPYFYVEALKMTTAELPSEKKNKISHRANALKKLKRKLDEEQV
jgi:XTP/dITP diphosphohydrolase